MYITLVTKVQKKDQLSVSISIEKEGNIEYSAKLTQCSCGFPFPEPITLDSDYKEFMIFFVSYNREPYSTLVEVPLSELGVTSITKLLSKEVGVRNESFIKLQIQLVFSQYTSRNPLESGEYFIGSCV